MQLIFSAIDSLNEKNGSSKTRIAKYIESKHGELPAGHAMLISHHLSKMKDAGELVFFKNNYLRPDPNSPKRGRGRPPKPKTPLPEGYVAPSPKSRGRPKKAKDPLAVAVEKASKGLPKPRGRPPKKAAKSAPAAPSSGKRGRGRPKKEKPAVEAVGA